MLCLSESDAFCTSSRQGMLAAAPGIPTAIALALLAVSIAASALSPAAVMLRKYPVKVSPAPVVSTTLTMYARWLSVFSPS